MLKLITLKKWDDIATPLRAGGWTKAKGQHRSERVGSKGWDTNCTVVGGLAEGIIQLFIRISLLKKISTSITYQLARVFRKLPAFQAIIEKNTVLKDITAK